MRRVGDFEVDLCLDFAKSPMLLILYSVVVHYSLDLRGLVGVWSPGSQAPGSTGTGRRTSSHVGVYSTMSESRPMMAMWTRNMDQYFTRSSSGHDDATRPSQPRSQPALTSNLEPGRSCLEASDKTSRLKKEQPTIEDDGARSRRSAAALRR